MKIIRIIRKSIKDAFKSVFRNFSLSLASISCTAVSLILIAFAILITYNANAVTKNIESVLSITVFINKDATEEQVQEFINNVNDMKNIDEDATKFLTSEELKTQISEYDEDIKSALSTLTENPLSSTATFKVRDVKKITETAEAIKNMEIVERIEYGEKIVNSIISMVDAIRKFCYIGLIALVFVTFFLISNTIKITIFSRRNEINIMRLVGTSNMVIKLPFIIEGFVLGLIGSIIPVVLTIYGYQFLYDFIGGKLFVDLMVLVKPSEIVYTTSLVLVLVGSIVGMFASLKAVKRYLKV